MAEKLNIPTDPTELAVLVDEVAGLLADMAKSEAKDEGKLAKAEESKEEAGPAEEAPAPSPSAPPEAPAEEPAPEAPPQEEAPQAEEPAQDQEMSVEDLAAMYQQLSPEQLEMHKQAIAMIEQTQGEAPAEAPAASPSPSPSPAPEMAMKSEAKIQELEEKLSKAIEEVRQAREEANKATSMTVDVLEKMASAPKSKAVTGITFHKYMPVESEKPLRKNLVEMTPAEIKKELAEIVKSPALSKADREVINDYCLYPGRVSIDKLEKFFNK